jgi:hypothetical protein
MLACHSGVTVTQSPYSGFMTYLATSLLSLGLPGLPCGLPHTPKPGLELHPVSYFCLHCLSVSLCPSSCPIAFHDSWWTSSLGYSLSFVTLILLIMESYKVASILPAYPRSHVFPFWTPSKFSIIAGTIIAPFYIYVNGKAFFGRMKMTSGGKQNSIFVECQFLYFSSSSSGMLPKLTTHINAALTQGILIWYLLLWNTTAPASQV